MATVEVLKEDLVGGVEWIGVGEAILANGEVAPRRGVVTAEGRVV